MNSNNIALYTYYKRQLGGTASHIFSKQMFMTGSGVVHGLPTWTLLYIYRIMCLSLHGALGRIGHHQVARSSSARFFAPVSRAWFRTDSLSIFVPGPVDPRLVQNRSEIHH